MQAMTHRSFHHEEAAGSSVGHNEKLEFLGDAVLDLALSDQLMGHFAHLDEGSLSRIRASLVNEKVLAEIALELGMDERLRLGRGELQTGGAKKPRLLSSAFEAYLGAVYLDGGFEVAKELVQGLFAKRLKLIDPQGFFDEDYKTRLQELLQERFRLTPRYELVSEQGPAHDRLFQVAVIFQDQALAKGQGRSKKQAEQEAARAALQVIQQQGVKRT